MVPVLVRCDDGQEVPEKERYRRLGSAVGIVYGRLDRVGGATRSLDSMTAITRQP
jgi:hypothetical protein